MQTFLPYPTYNESTHCLDNKRLGKQRVEVLQILKAIHGETKAWQNHPATRMWKKYPNLLALYGIICCEEWNRRGFKDTCYHKIKAHVDKHPWPEFTYPPWFTEEFCKSHQSNLLRKDPVFYSQYHWNVPNNLPYIWPV